MNNSKVVEDFDIHSMLCSDKNESVEEDKEKSSENSVKTENEKPPKEASSDVQMKETVSDDDEPFSDAEAAIFDDSKNVFVSAAMSIDYEKFPPTSKFIRGENIISCWAMRSTSSDSCIFEWLLCCDLKGSLPKYVLNTVSDDMNQCYSSLYSFQIDHLFLQAFLSLMTDYMVHIRTHIESLKKKV